MPIATPAAATTTYHDVGLSPNTTYYYLVQAVNSDGASGDSNVFQVMTPTSPAPPSNLTATLISPTEVDLAWTDNAVNATGYKILQQLQSNNFALLASGLSSTADSYDITGLTPGTSYHFEVDATNSAGPSSSASIGLNTLCAAPTGLTATPGGGKVTLTWNADTGAVSYNIYRGPTPGGEGATPYATGIAIPLFNDGNVVPGATYYYEVTAVDANSATSADPAGESADSAEVSAVPTTLAGVSFATGFTGATGLQFNGGAAVVNGDLQLTDGGGYEARSAFTTNPLPIAAFSTAFTFQLSSATADGFTFTIQGSSPTALGSRGGGLGYGPDNTAGPPGIADSVAVKFDLSSNQGEGPDSTGLFTDGAAPTDVGSINLSGSGINLHSGDVMLASLSYDGTNLTETIQDTHTGATFTHVYTNVNIPALVGGDSAYVGFTAGTGALTAVQNVLTWSYDPSTSPPAAPTGLTATPGSGQVTLTWTTDTGAVSYNIYRGPTPGGEGATPYATGIAIPLFNDGNVVPGATYYYEVTAVDANSATSADPAGESVDSAEVSAVPTTLAGVSFANGFAGATGLQFNGGAAVVKGSLQLTDGGGYERAASSRRTRCPSRRSRLRSRSSSAAPRRTASPSPSRGAARRPWARGAAAWATAPTIPPSHPAFPTASQSSSTCPATRARGRIPPACSPTAPRRPMSARST